MINWLQNLPKSMFVAVVLSVGVLFIVLSDPPRTICDSQLNRFKEVTHNFLQIDKTKKNQQKSRFTKLYETCKTTNSSGGCFELFSNLKRTLKDTQTVSPECFAKVGAYKEFSEMLWLSLDLLTIMAWGASPPLSPAQKVNWFDASDLNLFCSLKKTAIDFNSQGRWDNFINGYFESLPGANTITREDAWARMLFSVSCQQYM